MYNTTFKKTLFLLHLLKHDFIGAFGFNIGLILKDEMQKILLPLIKHGFFSSPISYLNKKKSDYKQQVKITLHAWFSSILNL